MKKLIVLTVLLFMGAATYAQDTTKNKQTIKWSPMYICPKCDHTSTTPGKCPGDNMTMVKEGMYYCKMDDGQVSENAGKCPKCGMEMVKMERPKEKMKDKPKYQ